MVVRQLGGVNKGVVVSIGALDDLPTSLIFGFLRQEQQKHNDSHVNKNDLVCSSD